MDKQLSEQCDDDNISQQYNLINEQEMVELEERRSVELTQREKINESMKRTRDEEEWTVVGGREKKLKEDITQIYISSNDKLPKQFALAKLFDEIKVKGIMRVKYISLYKIRLDITDESSAINLMSNEDLSKKGWRIHKAMEKSMSYGVIRNIDLDVSEEDIMKNVTCPSPAKLISAKRLMSRNIDREGWTNCESVRLCFAGSFLPAYVCVDSLRIKVEPYVFPVSQCSKCWKFGHTVRFCPSPKVVCPKCGENHQNCDTASFKCVNCLGNHMALDRSCPFFAEEMKI